MTLTQRQHRRLRRARVRSQLYQWIEVQRHPRLFMSFAIVLTSSLMLIESWGLREVGMESLWSRYLLVFWLGYGFFLLMIRAWLHYEHDQMDLPSISTDTYGDSATQTGFEGAGFEGHGGDFSGAGSQGQWGSPQSDSANWGGSLNDGGQYGLDFAAPNLEYGSGAQGLSSSSDLSGAGDVGNAAEGLPLLAILAILLVIITALGSVVWSSAMLIQSSPALLTELSFDLLVSSGLYRRYRLFPSDGRHWVHTLWLHTWKIMIAVTVMILLLGAILHVYNLNVSSLGELLALIF